MAPSRRHRVSRETPATLVPSAPSSPRGLSIVLPSALAQAPLPTASGPRPATVRSLSASEASRTLRPSPIEPQQAARARGTCLPAYPRLSPCSFYLVWICRHRTSATTIRRFAPHCLLNALDIIEDSMIFRQADIRTMEGGAEAPVPWQTH